MRLLDRVRRTGKRWLRQSALKPGRGAEADARREELAIRYLRGDGIEIGALHRPLWVPRGTRVRYVDVMGRSELLTALKGTYDDPRSIVETDIVDDGERLDKVADESVDFVIANHVLEHTEDPIAALNTWLRVLRSNGILFLTLPDARYTFDVMRPRTSVQHVLKDHNRAAGSRDQHYREWARLVEHLAEEHVPERIVQFYDEKPCLHFHVWELESFLELLHRMRLPFCLEVAQVARPEFAIVLRKQALPTVGARHHDTANKAIHATELRIDAK